MMTASKFDCPSWFKLDRYGRTGDLDFEGWHTQIGTRICLAGWLAAGKTEEFDKYFAVIAETPFMDIGFEANYPSGEAAYPTTFGVAEAMVDTLKPLAPHRKTNCDQMLSDIGQDSFAMHAHLTIDFNASETEIKTDFDVWLKSAIAKNREQFPRSRDASMTANVIKSWHTHQILPYQDLWLWHQRQGREMPAHPMLLKWLFPKTYDGKDKVRDTIAKAKFAFQLATLRQLSLAAE